jgi:hypothetical protein
MDGIDELLRVFLWGRGSAERLDRFGDVALLARELAAEATQ